MLLIDIIKKLITNCRLVAVIFKLLVVIIVASGCEISQNSVDLLDATGEDGQLSLFTPDNHEITKHTIDHEDGAEAADFQEYDKFSIYVANLAGRLHGLNFDSAGNLFGADYDNNVIWKITPEGRSEIFAGTGEYGNLNGETLSASFSNPFDLAIDSYDNLYVASAAAGTIRKITKLGLVTTFAGGKARAGGFCRSKISDTFGAVRAFSIDERNNMVVAATDGQLSHLTKFTMIDIMQNRRKSCYTSLAGNISAIASAKDGLIYVAASSALQSTTEKIDTNILYIVNQDGDILAVIGSGKIGAEDGSAKSASFNDINDLAIDSRGLVYVIDSGNNLIRQINKRGEVKTLASDSFLLTDEGTKSSFDQLSSIAIDRRDNLYVSDLNNYRIVKIAK